MSGPSLTLDERDHFYLHLQSKQPLSAIARAMGRHRSSLYDELNRCGSTAATYRPARAQRHRDAASKRSIANHRTIANSEWAAVKRQLRADWSPEQISGRRTLLGEPAISVQAIYDYTTREHCRHLLRYPQLRQHLQRPARHPWQGSAASIHKRAKAVMARLERGHWETDTAVGKRTDHKRLIVSVERQSLYVVLRLLPQIDARLAATLIKRDLPDAGLPFHTITSDRGSEFRALGDIFPGQAFVCDAGQPNQRGTNENQIGLVRQYYPKGKSMNNLSPAKIKRHQHKLNHRPHKSLGYQTAFEVMFDCPPTVGTRS